MSKRIRSLILAAVLVAVLVGGVLAVRLLPEPEADASSAASATTGTTLPALIDKAETDKSYTVKEAVVTLENETFTVKPDADGVMAVEAYADLPRRTEMLESLLKALTTIRPASLVKEQATDEELTACGFDKPQAAVSVTYENGSTYAFEIGKLDPGGKTNSYFREADSRAVYLMGSSFVSSVTQGSTSYIGLTMITAPSPNSDDSTGKAQLMELRLSGSLRPTPVVLRYKTAEDDKRLSLASPYTITAPYYRTTDSQVTTGWQTGLNTLTAASVAAVHPTAEQLVEYGLSDPRSVGELTLAVYQEGSEEADPVVYNGVSFTVRLGGKDESGNYYAMLDGVDIVYTVAASNVPWAEEQYGDLLADFLFLEYITDLKSVTLTLDGKENCLVLTHGKDENDKDTMAVTLDGVAYDDSGMRSLYQVLMSIHRLKETEEAAAPEGESVITMKLAFTDEEKEPFEVSLYAYSANRYLCRQPDGDTYLVKASEVETMLAQVRSYLSTPKA